MRTMLKICPSKGWFLCLSVCQHVAAIHIGNNFIHVRVQHALSLSGLYLAQYICMYVGACM